MNKKLSHLNQMINDVYTTGRTQNTINLMNNMLCLMSQGCNLSPLAASIVKLLPMANVPLKKVVCTYLIRYSGKISDLSILTTNTLRKDYSDPNPHIRKLVIKTACSIPSLRDLSLDLLPKALQDQSVYVKRTAAALSPKVITVNTDECSDIIDQLYGMVRDDDPLVVVNVLMALDEILEPEGGIVINYKMAQYLMRRMLSFPDGCMSSVCNVLKKYESKNKDEALTLLNILDSLLSNGKSLVLIPAMDLALSLIKTLNSNFEKDILERVLHSLLLVFKDSSPELLYVILEHLEYLICTYSDLFSNHYKQFLCNFNDPICLKIKKLHLLSLLLQNNNCGDIAENAINYLTGCKEISQAAITTFTKILSFEDVATSHHHVEILLQLMTSNRNHIIEDIIISLSCLDLQKFSEWKNPLLLAVSENYYKVCSHDGKKALLCIICTHGENIDNIVYIIEEMINNEDNLSNEVICSFLLTAAIKTFLSRPAEMQLLLGKFLEKTGDSSSAIVKSQVLFYNSLLQIDLEIAAKILNLIIMLLVVVSTRVFIKILKSEIAPIGLMLFCLGYNIIRFPTL